MPSTADRRRPARTRSGQRSPSNRQLHPALVVDGRQTSACVVTSVPRRVPEPGSHPDQIVGVDRARQVA